MNIRKLTFAECALAYPLVVQLRDLSIDTFIASVSIQAEAGYEMVGAFKGQDLVGFMGFRPVHTLARGPHLHIDDLVVDQQVRNQKIGEALIDYAKSEAQSRAMNFIFLDARKEAIPFYQRHQFTFHQALSMKFSLK